MEANHGKVDQRTGTKDEKRSRSYKLTTLKINYRSTLGLFLLHPRPHIIQWHVRSTLSCNSRGSSWILVLVAAATCDMATPRLHYYCPLVMYLLPFWLSSPSPPCPYILLRVVSTKKKKKKTMLVDEAFLWRHPSILSFTTIHPLNNSCTPSPCFVPVVIVQTDRPTLYVLPYPWMGLDEYISVGGSYGRLHLLDWSTRALTNDYDAVWAT